MKDIVESGQLESTLLSETHNNETIDEEPMGKDGESSVGELIPANESTMKYETTEISMETDVSSVGMEAFASLIGDAEAKDIISELEMTEKDLELHPAEEVIKPVEGNTGSQMAMVVETEGFPGQDNIELENKGAAVNNSDSSQQLAQLQRRVNDLQENVNRLLETICSMRDEIKETSDQVKALLDKMANDTPIPEDAVPGQEAVLSSDEANENEPQYSKGFEVKELNEVVSVENISCKLPPMNTDGSEEPAGERKNERDAISVESNAEDKRYCSLQEIAQKAYQQAVNGCIKDQQELDAYQESALGWAKKGKIIQEALPEMVIHCNDVLQQAELARESVSGQSDKLRDLIMGRQEGIILIVNRMISRLPEKASSLTEDKSLETKLPQMDLSEWQKLLNGGDNVEEANKKLASRQKQLGTERYRILANWREESDKKRKTILSFVERQVLPVLDGIGDGERHSEPIILQVQEAAELQGKAMNSSLQLWFDTYRALREEILKLLAMVGIRRLDVKRGDKMDYDRHEPFDVEQDMALDNEYIKEVIRDGFEYWMEEDKLHRVLRPAQVIIVKN